MMLDDVKDDVKDVELVREHQRSKQVIDWTQFHSNGTETPPEMTWAFFQWDASPSRQAASER